MNAKAFFDSNLLVYAFGPFDAQRSMIARDLITECTGSQRGVVSYPVVQEFLKIAFKKFQPRTSPDRALEYLEEVVASFEILPWSMPLVTSALAIKHRYGFRWYDSSIVAAAIQSGCSLLYTEELQQGERIEGLTVVNLFSTQAPVR